LSNSRILFTYEERNAKNINYKYRLRLPSYDFV
jgi:hypothetical protein